MWRRRRGQRGAVAVEAALVTPIFVLLVFGIIEFGMLFKDWLAVSSSVRAGTRIASAQPRIADYADQAASQIAREGAALDLHEVAELWVYRAAEDGTPTGDTGDFATCDACVKYSWNGSTFVEQSNSWPSTDQNACQGDPDRDSVGVYMRFEHQSVTNLIFEGFDIEEHTVMALEPIPTTRGCRP